MYWRRRGWFGSSMNRKSISARSSTFTSKPVCSGARSLTHCPTGRPTRPGRVLAIIIPTFTGLFSGVAFPDLFMLSELIYSYFLLCLYMQNHCRGKVCLSGRLYDGGCVFRENVAANRQNMVPALFLLADQPALYKL